MHVGVQPQVQQPLLQRVQGHLQVHAFWYCLAVGSSLMGSIMAKIIWEVRAGADAGGCIATTSLPGSLPAMTQHHTMPAAVLLLPG
jgi:hypothetical protein